MIKSATIPFVKTHGASNDFRWSSGLASDGKDVEIYRRN